MKTFREHIKEEIKIGALASGGIDIDREAVRDEINGILAGIASRPCVTPYNALYKVRKALSYFNIHLPNKVYLEGKHGVEVWEVNQFGNKMGVTDQGDWIKDVPAKYHLFFHYHLVGSMYFLEAKIVGEDELESKVNAAERFVAESTDAAVRQDVAKHNAPKDPLHDVTSDEKKKGNKEAVSDSEKGLNEVSLGKLVRYKNKAGEGREKGRELADKKMKGKAKVNASMPKHPYMEETLDEVKQSTLKSYGNKAYHSKSKAEMEKGKEFGPHARFVSGTKYDAIIKKRDKGIERASDRTNPNQKWYVGEEQIDETRMPASVIKHKQRIANMTPEEKAKKFAGKSQEELKAMARRHGFGKDSNEYSKHVKEEQIDEVNKGKEKRYDDIIKAFKTAPGQVGGQSTRERDAAISKHMGGDVHKGEIRRAMKRHFHTKGLYEDDQINEKAPPGAKFERMVKHIKKGYSKGGLSAKEKSIAYATAWKAKKKEQD